MRCAFPVSAPDTDANLESKDGEAISANARGYRKQRPVETAGSRSRVHDFPRQKRNARCTLIVRPFDSRSQRSPKSWMLWL